MALEAMRGSLPPTRSMPVPASLAAPADPSAGEARFDALWTRSHTGPGALSGARVYAEVVARYGEPHRRYHTLDHVHDCLRRFDWISHLTPSPDAVELALWFHDVIYAQRADDNERRSAMLYNERAIGASPEFRRHVSSLILITRHVEAAHGLDRGYVVDIDLGGFGLPWEEFRRQGRLVRDECPWQTEAEHAAGLACFLRRLIARPRFFATDYFHARFEQVARANIARLFDEWRELGYLPAGSGAAASE